MGLQSLLGMMEMLKDALRAADEHLDIVDGGTFGGSMKVCPGGIDGTDVTQFRRHGTAEFGNRDLYFCLDGVRGRLCRWGVGVGRGGAVGPVKIGGGLGGEGVERGEEGRKEGRWEQHEASAASYGTKVRNPKGGEKVCIIKIERVCSKWDGQRTGHGGGRDEGYDGDFFFKEGDGEGETPSQS